jgi:hypothetical protein
MLRKKIEFNFESSRTFRTEYEGNMAICRGLDTGDLSGWFDVISIEYFFYWVDLLEFILYPQNFLIQIIKFSFDSTWLSHKIFFFVIAIANSSHKKTMKLTMKK